MSVCPCHCYTNTDVSGRELVTHGSADFPIACYYAHAGFDPVPPHWHNEIEMIVATRDDMNVHVQMEDHILHAGEGIFINANILHAAYQCSHLTDFHSLVFSPELIAGNDRNIFWQKYVQPVISDTALPYILLSPDIPWQKQMIEDAEAAWHEAEKEKGGYEFRMRTDLSDCFLLLTENSGTRQDTNGLRNFAKEQRLKKMLTYINTHYSETIALQDIAAAASVSTTECLRCFREGLKQSPIQYTKKYRMIIAAKYLKTTDWPVNEIAGKCGFQEMGYFSVQFRKTFGMTPTEYRKEG